MNKFNSTCFGPCCNHTFRGLLAGIFIGFSALIKLAAAENTPDLSVFINRSPIFYQNLIWIGNTSPAEAENRTLWSEIQDMQLHGVGPSLPAIEKFINDHPDSPWVPSLRANLGRYYREHGRYTKALQHWELAWNATRAAKDGAAKNIADFTFAHWTRLLGSLGRVDTLRFLFQETQNRVFDAGPLQQIISGTKEGYRDMVLQPGTCFKCGTFALINVAKTIKGANFDPQPIDGIPSPVTGFTMSKLTDLAQESSLDLVPADWSDNRKIVVPSIIHWKQDHFAAIVEQKKEWYRVVDPTFEEPRWLKADEILEEASGHFLVPKSRMPSDWKILQRSQTDHIFGRGRPYDLPNKNDGCGNGSGGGSGGPGCGGGDGGGCDPGDDGSGGQGGNPSDFRVGDTPQSPGNANIVAGDSSYGQGGKGMPVWRVSEPYISVWLYDTPLSYSPGLGYPVVFKMAYKQREEKIPSSSVFSIGKMWNCNWLGYVTFNGDNDPAPILEVPGGGQRTYTPDGATREFLSDTTLTTETDGAGHTVGYLLSYANGAKQYYNYIIGFQGEQAAFLTDQVDRYGHTNHLVYVQTNSLTLLQYVTDADGRTNTLSYTNSNFPAQPTAVTDPFGRTVTLRYDSTGILTNVIDVAGISNSFKYDFQGWVTNLITPYGTTTFFHYTNNLPGVTNEFYEGTNGTYGPYFNIRTVKVVDPAGSTNVYVLRANSNYAGPNHDDFLNTDSYGTDFTIVPDATQLPGYPWSSVDNVNLQYRNTFHWGPRQAAGLPDVIDNYTASNYREARRRHWLHNFSDSSLSQILSMEQDPSVDGSSEGQTTWYDYFGKVNASYFTGTQSKPSFIVRVLPDTKIQYTWFRRDEWDRPTNVVQTYTVEFGQSPLTRTNIYVYDGADLVTQIGPRGETLEGLVYNGNHQLLRQTNAVGDVWYYTYDSSGRLTQIISSTGLTTTNIYFGTGDYANWVQTRIDMEINRTNFFTYTNDLVYTHTDERGLITTNLCDNLNRLTNSSDSRGKITYTYDKLDLIQTVDRMGFTNRYVYDAVRRMTAHTNALGRYSLYNYCSCGALDSVRDTEGNYTYYFYDVLGRLTNQVFADGYSITNKFNGLGQITNTTDSAGMSVTNWFNNQGLRYVVTTASGNREFIDFDDEDRATNIVNSEGVSVAMTYDNLGRLRTRAYYDGSEKFGYSAAGLIAYTNQIGMTNFFVYDAAGRKAFETNANTELIRYTNDAAGDLLSLTDGKGQTTRWNYDQYGRVTNKLDQAGTEVLRYKYDAENRLTNRWSAAKGDTYYSYDPVGNLTNIDYPSSSDVAFAYDGLNRMTNMVDGIGTTKYTYTAAGQLLTEDGPFASDTVTNGYSNRLRTNLSLQQPTGVWTNAFAYDSTKRLTNVTSSAGAFGYVYDPTLFTRHASRLTLPNTSYVTNAFDGNARLIATYLENSGNTVLDSYIYIYNPANQRTNLTRADTSTVAYQYDPIGQLKVANSSVNTEDRGYTYDSAWNLNYRTNNGVSSTFVVDNKNELTNAFGGANAYDSNGNLIISRPLPRLWWLYSYDDENRLIQLIHTNSASGATTNTTFVYDGLGRLRKRLESSSETHYIYDGWRVIQERNESNLPLVSYTRGNDLSGSMEGAGGISGLLARSDGYSGGNFTTHNYYFADGNGNVTYMLNSSQSMVASYRYDPFGNTISSSGTLASANVYRFSSKEIHANSGMYNYGFRFYDPNVQRWINRDPIEEWGGVNLYCFVYNAPTSDADPLGFDGTNTGGVKLEPGIILRPFPISPAPTPTNPPVQVPPTNPPPTTIQQQISDDERNRRMAEQIARARKGPLDNIKVPKLPFGCTIAPDFGNPIDKDKNRDGNGNVGGGDTTIGGHVGHDW